MIINKALDEKYVKITTFVQAKYHLDKGEILVCPISVFTTICAKRFEDRYEVAYVPMFGKATIYDGEEEAMVKLCNEFKFYVVPGLDIIETKPPLLWVITNKIYNFFRRSR